jgi:predicted phosphoadenosine phosphosulfate sulfurtransferase
MKTYLDVDVFTAARQRINRVFDDFEKVYVSFSGGKDSGVLLNLALGIARERDRLPVHVLVVDLEAQYKLTVDFVQRMVGRSDVVVHWVCLPLHLRNSVSQFQPFWLCWDPERQDQWVRPIPDHPGVIKDEMFFPFFRRGMEFEELVPEFGEWFADGTRTACLVGIRSDESLNRFRTIQLESKVRWAGFGWTTLVTPNVYNAYPIYDWAVEDVWTATTREKWDYNRVYDLMYLAGLTPHQMRLCQPYGDDQRKGLWLFKILEPETWDSVVSRVEGANFGSRHSRSRLVGLGRADLPQGHTWKSYTQFLLESMPCPLAEHYQKKINTFLAWWAERGFPNDIPDENEKKLEADRKGPSWRRIAKVLIKNDYWCKGLSFSMTKKEHDRRLTLALNYLEKR